MPTGFFLVPKLCLGTQVREAPLRVTPGHPAMSRTRYRIWEQEQPHFLTWTVVAWLPVFTRPETSDIILDSWRYLQQHRGFQLYGYVILENHLHLIASS